MSHMEFLQELAEDFSIPLSEIVQLSNTLGGARMEREIEVIVEDWACTGKFSQPERVMTFEEAQAHFARSR